MDFNSDDFKDTSDAAGGGAKEPAMPAMEAPDARGEEDKGQESASGAELAGAEGSSLRGALLTSTSTNAADAAQPPEAEVAPAATNRAQRRALGIKPEKNKLPAQIGDLPPPVANEDILDPDQLTFQGRKFLAGWDELMEEAAKPADIVIGPFEAETLAITSGEPGRGKSLLSLTMAVATAGGVEFGGLKPPRAQPALVFSPEDKLRMIGARIKAAVEELKADAEIVKRNLRVINVPGSSMIFEGAGESLDFNPLGRLLRRAILATRARFVVLDPFIELHSADENSNMQVHALLASLRTLARETGSLIFLTHHSAKGGQGPRGAGAFLGTVRASLHVDGLGKEEVSAAKAKGLRPASIFKVVSIKNSYGGDLDGGMYFQKVAIREGEAPVLRRVELEMDEAVGK